MHQKNSSFEQELSPVCIHSSWRTSKTWLWSKFRALPRTLAFYEPCSEHMLQLTRENLAEQTPKNWHSNHPESDEPYFKEYFPLIQEEGVAGYHGDFAIRHFFTDTDPLPYHAQTEEEMRYLESLVQSARLRGGRPVFGFARTLGRIGTIKRRLGGHHLIVMRNLYKQWKSMVTQQRQRNGYFCASYFMIAGQCRHHPFLGPLAERFGIPDIRGNDLDREREIYQILCERATPAEMYEVFLRVQTAAYLSALAWADLVVDTDLLAENATARQTMETEIRDLTGLQPDLSDCTGTTLAIEPEEEYNVAITESVLHDVVRGSFETAEPKDAPYLERARAMTVSLLQRTIHTLRTSLRTEAISPSKTYIWKSWEELNELAHTLTDHLQTAEKKLDRIRSSWAWKITLPLRMIYRGVQRCKTALGSLSRTKSPRLAA